jgi:hypothetical protein
MTAAFDEMRALEHGWSITPIAGFTRRYITDGRRRSPA